MKLVKPLEVALSIAATGGVMLVLSGSAFAADGGTSTTSQTVTQTSAQKAETQSVKSQGVGAVSVSVVTKDKTTSDAASVVPATSTDQKAAASSPVSADPAKDGTKTTVVSAAIAEQAGSGAGNTLAAGKSDMSERDDTKATSPGMSSAPNPTVANFTASKPAGGSVLFHSTVLAIQPRITTSRSMVVEDLADTVPSAQQQSPAKSPAPLQPSGALGRLTAVLAASVVPHMFSSPALSHLATSVLVAGLLMIILLSLRRVALTFGAWLRRGGYAHAARSDVAAAITTIFATPLNLSYVLANAPVHNSFLMVSDNKTDWFYGPQRFQKGGK